MKKMPTIKCSWKPQLGDVVKVPKEYLGGFGGQQQKEDELKMVRKIYKRPVTIRGNSGRYLKRNRLYLELQGHIFTQDLPADEVELWIAKKG